MEVSWLWKLVVYRKTYEITTKESHLFQLLVHQHSPQNLGRKWLWKGIQCSLILCWRMGHLGFILGSTTSRAQTLESPGTGLEFYLHRWLNLGNFFTSLSHEYGLNKMTYIKLQHIVSFSYDCWCFWSYWPAFPSLFRVLFWWLTIFVSDFPYIHVAQT